MKQNFECQCDKNECFCLSNIDKTIMQSHGLNMTKAELKRLARRSKPHAIIWTGSRFYEGMARRTRVYRYEDFKKYNV